MNYKIKEIMTEAEKQVYHYLFYNLHKSQEIVILSKVKLTDIIDINTSDEYDYSNLNTIINMHLDFVICDINLLHIICAIELDDYTHFREDVKVRDKIKNNILESVGIKLFRISTPVNELSRTGLKSIDKFINEYLAPLCPHCGTKMVQKVNRLTGQRFYSCPNVISESNKKCMYTISIDTGEEKLP